MRTFIPRLLVAGLLSAASPLYAQWSGLPGQNNPLLAGVAGNLASGRVEVISDGSGGLIAVWADMRNGTTAGYDIFAQHLDAQGARAWGDAGVTVCSLPGNQPDGNGAGLRIAADGTGGVFIHWSDNRDGTIRPYVQHLDAAGVPQWTANGVVLPHAVGTGAVAGGVLADGVGGVYCGKRLGNGYAYAHLHRLKSDGTADTDNGWGVNGLDTGAAAGYQGTVLDVLPTTTDAGIPGTGTSALVIVDAYQGAIRKVHRNATLGWLVSLTNYGTSGNWSTISCWTSDGAGGVLLDVQHSSTHRVLRIKADGTYAWPSTTAPIVSDAASALSTVEAIVSDGAGGGYLFCSAIVGSNTEIRLYRFGADGAAVWPAPIVVDSGATFTGGVDAEALSAVSDGAGGVIIAWRDYSNNVWSTVSQRYSPSGQALWTAPFVVNATPSNGIVSLVQVSDDNGGALVIGDTRNAGSVQARKISLTGALGSNSPSARLANISARSSVGSGGGVLIPGFVVSGGSLQLLVRGVGPRLAGFGVGGVIPDPQLSLVNGSGATVATNDDWGSATNLAELTAATSQVHAFGLATGSKDAAMLVTLQPGLYTAVMSSAVAGETGVGLVELYEINGASSPGRLANMSVRAQVGTGEGVLIPGIVVGGTGARTLLVRAVGPTLANFGVAGVLANPTMTLFAGSTAVGTNDNWNSNTTTGAQISAVRARVGAFSLPSNSQDSALLLTLAPGAYTAQVSGVGGTTGICLVEVYEVP